MNQRNKPAVSNAKFAVFFFALLILIVGVSLIVKAVIVVRAGQFDDANRFTVGLDNGKNVEIISFSPDLKNATVFKFDKSPKLIEIGKILEIPIDGFVVFDSLNLDRGADVLLKETIFNYNRLKTNLTIIDLVRLYFLAKSIPNNSLEEVKVADINKTDINSVVGRLVIDDALEKDMQTIRIVNATEVSGLGSRLAKFITNIGGNVILVTTDSPRNKSVITYKNKKTYTVERLAKILGYDIIQESGNAVSDVSIIIGEDKLNVLPF
jgi:hypothetical protein